MAWALATDVSRGPGAARETAEVSHRARATELAGLHVVLQIAVVVTRIVAVILVGFGSHFSLYQAVHVIVSQALRARSRARMNLGI
jgi:hypothetical protein